MVGKEWVDDRKISSLKSKARKRSIQEGIFATAKASFGEYYLSPFAIAINASNSLIVLMASIGGILGPISQLFGSRLMEKYSRRKIIVRSVFSEILVWLPLIAIAVLFYSGILTDFLPIAFLLVFAFYVIFSSIGAPAWFSWMGDLVGDKYRGRFFSKRSFITGFVSVVLAVSASFFLDYFGDLGWTMYGFIILFALAFFARIVSLSSYKKMYEPKLKLKKSDYFSFTSFLLKAPKTNFGRFSIFRALLAFSVSIASPLFAIYMLRNLSFSYSTYMIITLAGTVFALLVIQIWGRIADKYGNYKVMYLSTILIPLVPILWIFSSSPLYLILVPTLIGGISWAGFGLAAGNFIYDNVTHEKRGLAVSYYNMLMGIGIFLGAGLGALLIKFLTVSFIEPILLIFLISGIARMFAVGFFIPLIKEIKKKEKFDGKKTFKQIIFKEMGATLVEEFHEIISLKKYVRGK